MTPFQSALVLSAFAGSSALGLASFGTTHATHGFSSSLAEGPEGGGPPPLGGGGPPPHSAR
jgi:hypothetical protein